MKNGSIYCLFDIFGGLRFDKRLDEGEKNQKNKRSVSTSDEEVNPLQITIESRKPASAVKFFLDGSALINTDWSWILH